MRIQTRIIGAAMLVVAVVSIVYAVYFLGKERRAAREQLDATVANNETLLKVVTAGPLYDGNVEQLDAILDTLFTNPDITHIDLMEYQGNIRMYRTRSPATSRGTTITSRILIMRSLDELGEMTTEYSTARIEQRLLQSRNNIFLFSFILVLGLSGVIFVVARGLTRPIERLTAAAREMANGRLEQEITPSGTEELQSLGHSFIRMRDAVREKMADLAAKNDALQLKDRAIASSVNGIAIADPEGHLTYVNPSFLRLWGYDDSSQVLGKPALDFWQSPAQAAEIIETLRMRGACSGELIAKRRDGSLFPVELSASLMSDEQGKPSYLMASFIDISERKVAEDALRESEDRFRSIFNGAMDGIVLTDATTGTFVIGNRKICAMLGYTEDELRTMRPADIHPPDIMPRVVKHLEDTARGHISEAQELAVRRKDGSLFYADINASVLTLGGRPHFVEIFRDISERKRAKEEKARLEAQLMQAQKMESIGRLAGGVAHDFNNMLSIILGYADLAKRRLPADDPLVQSMQEIENAALRSRELTGQLLAFSRKQIIAPKTVDLNAHLRATSKTLMRLIGEDIELRFNPAEGLWYTRIDPLQVDQIIMNLAVNARDAMPKGGTLTIETSNVHLDEEQCSRYVDCLPGSYVQLAVSDSGNGMDRDTLSHIFEPFFTTKEFGKGTGLGLATIYGIVKQNNGFISVASEKARGSTFTIYLPRTNSEHAGPEAAVPAPEVSGSGTILLVEDDATVRGLVSQLLESLGYTVLPAESPSQALSLCGEADRSIDLLMTDVVMPQMNGKDLMERVTKIRPGIKVLFMSGYTASVIATHGVLDDGLYFIQKPFGIDTLAAKVREALTGGS